MGKSIVDVGDWGKVAGYVSGKVSVVKKGVALSVMLGWEYEEGRRREWSGTVE